MIKIIPCPEHTKQRFEDRDKNVFWSVMRLIDLSKDLEVFELPLKALNIYNMYPESIVDMHSFIAHIKQILKADLNYPIILDAEGYVMDGRHRIAKAILEEKESIKAVRFDETPCHCGFINEKKE